MEGEEKGFQLSSCSYLEEKLQECSKRGVCLATSVETFGVDLRTRTKQLGAKDTHEGKHATCGSHLPKGIASFR